MIQASNSGKARAVSNAGPSDPKTRIVVLGGGFGGVYTARHLEKLCARRPDVEIVLASRDNFFLMYPLLFEVCSGTLETRHCCVPIRAFLRTARFVEATVHRIDLDRRVVHAAALEGEAYELPYDQLVLALGAMGKDRAPQFVTSWVDCKSEAERAGRRRLGEHRSARLMQSSRQRSG